MKPEKPEVTEGGGKLFSYVETYRQMIEKINKFDKIIERKGTSKGKTLDMSNGKRRYSKHRNLDKAGKSTPSGSSYPSHVVDYGKLIGHLRQVQKNELDESKRCYLHV